jgi:hypothetical protein
MKSRLLRARKLLRERLDAALAGSLRPGLK